jgi:hypothetical protein
MELGEAGLGIGVDEGSPIDLVNSFQRAKREGVPRAAKPKTFAFELCLSLFSGNLSARLERFPITWNHDPKAVGKPVQPVVEYYFSSIIID